MTNKSIVLFFLKSAKPSVCVKVHVFGSCLVNNQYTGGIEPMVAPVSKYHWRTGTNVISKVGSKHCIHPLWDKAFFLWRPTPDPRSVCPIFFFAIIMSWHSYSFHERATCQSHQ